MRKYLSYLPITLLVAVAAGFGCERQEMTSVEFERGLERVLPAGTSLDRALVVLDSLQFARAPYDPETRTLRARLSERSRRVVTRTFQVTFHFDASRRIVSREVRERLTGP